MNPKYLEILVCPACQGSLTYNTDNQQLVCEFEQLAYPIIDGIMMLERSYTIDLRLNTTNNTNTTNTNITNIDNVNY